MVNEWSTLVKNPEELPKFDKNLGSNFDQGNPGILPNSITFHNAKKFVSSLKNRSGWAFTQNLPDASQKSSRILQMYPPFFQILPIISGTGMQTFGIEAAFVCPSVVNMSNSALSSLTESCPMSSNSWQP